MNPLTKIDSQTYQIGSFPHRFVIFKTDTGDWKMGTPIDWNYPFEAGFLVGSVSYHRTLRNAKALFFAQRRALRKQAHKHGITVSL
ncbi:MAG: hypothetical protein GY906_24245 [bacterium]|nr:hypothetical protein [bacterium]